MSARDARIESLSQLVDQFVKPTIDRLNQCVEIQAPKLAQDIDEQNGNLMATYADAGFYVGLYAGLELAELVRRRPQ